MKLTPRQVLALWRKNPAWAASLTTVRQALGAKKSQIPFLRNFLEELVDSGKLSYDRRRYRLPGEPTPFVAAPEAAPPGSTGSFSAHPDGFGFVAVEGQQADLFIPPGKIGAALDGDLVRVRLNRRGRDGRVSGEITGVLERGRRTARGSIHIERGETWVVPFNEKLPMVFVEPKESSVPYSPEDVVEVEITAYPENAQAAPAGRIIKVIEDGEAPQQILAAILVDLQAPTEFSKEALRGLSRFEKDGGDFSERGRKDLSSLPFVTIDGEDARDFDDAVSLATLPGGGWRLLVSIADVAHFVTPGSALDRDAYARGTSIYFPQAVVPMLPEILSNNLCSLRPGKRRLTMTCEIELDAAGNRKDYRIFSSVIQSQARLTYTQVRKFLESGKGKALGKAAPLAGMIGEMGKLAQVLRDKRRNRGALDFEFPEPRFAFENGGERPTEIQKAFPTPATRLIEQFMLEANETVAWHCTQNKISVLYRVHDPPPPDQIAELRLYLHNFGIETKEADLHEPDNLNRLLVRIREHPSRGELELSVLKALTQACYREHNDGHFGLNAKHYTHFTSPIRRYPDLLVHRALKHSKPASGKKETGQRTIPENAGLHLSSRERIAGQASGRALKLYRVLYMEPRLGESFDASVSGLNARGLWVALQDHFVEGFLPISALPGDQYRFNARHNVLSSRSNQRKIGHGQRLTVQLARAERMTQEIEFGFVCWEWDEPEDSRSTM